MCWVFIKESQLQHLWLEENFRTIVNFELETISCFLSLIGDIIDLLFWLVFQGTYVEGIKEEVVLSPGHALSFIAAGEGTYVDSDSHVYTPNCCYYYYYFYFLMIWYSWLMIG